MRAVGLTLVVIASIAVVVFRKPLARLMEARVRGLRPNWRGPDYTRVYELALTPVALLIAALTIYAAAQ